LGANLQTPIKKTDFSNFGFKEDAVPKSCNSDKETRQKATTPSKENKNNQTIFEKLNRPVFIDGAWILPFIQGGKGVGATNGINAGAWARENTGGTIAATGAVFEYDEDGHEIAYAYTGRTRLARHEEMVAFSIKGCIYQAQTAHKAANGKGRIRINFLKMAGASMRIMRGTLAGTRLPGGGNMIHAVTMGAGLASEDDVQICSDEGVFLDPIISSVSALKVLLKRTFRKWPDRYAELIGAVIYEDPWLAGGHNGITSREDPSLPQDPYERVKELRTLMNQNHMEKVTIVMAGGVWYLRDWQRWLNNPEIGPIAFQVGSRDLLTQESPISETWKNLILSMKKGDVALNKFSPTGFYSSTYNNAMIRDLYQRSQRQVPFATVADSTMSVRLKGPGVPAKGYFVAAKDKDRIDIWKEQGFEVALSTPDDTLVFVTRAQNREIKLVKAECVGCLSTCKLSTWSENPARKHTTGKRPDPRVHCIRKGLLGAIQGIDLDKQLIFAGHNSYKSGEDPFYRGENGHVFIPSVKQLIARLMTGN
jgi:NAD(P)H-dependent flavin oxidoreductase YrpB (nitropropane dioxygenase family)